MLPSRKHKSPLAAVSPSILSVVITDLWETTLPSEARCGVTGGWIATLQRMNDVPLPVARATGWRQHVGLWASCGPCFDLGYKPPYAPMAQQARLRKISVLHKPLNASCRQGDGNCYIIYVEEKRSHTSISLERISRPWGYSLLP